jgi:hypothetical protein
MLLKYIRYIILSLLIILSGATVAGLVSSKQPQTTIPIEKKVVQEDTTINNKKSMRQKISLVAPEKKPTVFTSTIILGWDIMLSRTIGADNKKQWYKRIFSGTNYHPIEAIPSCESWWCLLLMNLESPFSIRDNDIKERTFTFKSNTGNIAVLDSLRGKNTMALNLANNHVNNAWWEWIATTRSLLDQHGFFHLGAWNTPQQAKEIRTFKHNNITRCIWWYSYDWNWWIYWWKPLYRNDIYLSGMLSDLQMMKTQLRCDIKAMMLHRWSEYRIKPNKEQIIQAHTLIDNGLDIIIWWHSHVPWTIEVYSGKYIFYSLWNALFDQDRWMNAVQAWMDTIYDDILWKKTVPTYITIFPELIATKTTSWTRILLQQIHTARLEDWIFYPNDDKTRNNLLEKILY